MQYTCVFLRFLQLLFDERMVRLPDRQHVAVTENSQLLSAGDGGPMGRDARIARQRKEGHTGLTRRVSQP